MRRLAGNPGIRQNGYMEVAKTGKKRHLTIPRSVLPAAGHTEECRVLPDATGERANGMRPVAVSPIEMYSDERIREFEAANAIPAAMEKRVQAYLKKRAKR